MSNLHLVTSCLLILLGWSSIAGAQCEPAWLPGPPVGGVNNGPVYASVEWDPDGAGPTEPLIVIGGQFDVVNGTPARGLAAWDGVRWFPLGGGMGGNFVRVEELEVLPSGELLVAGEFGLAGGPTGIPARNMAVFDGAAWTEASPVTPSGIRDVAVLPNGDIVITGSFESIGQVLARRVARWDGVDWHPMGLGLDNIGLSVAAAPNGDIYVGGIFGIAGTINAERVARWDGVQWHALGPGVEAQVDALTVAPNGDLIVGGGYRILSFSGLARWDGSTWSQVGGRISSSSNVLFLDFLPDGRLLAGGTFTSVAGVACTGLAAWDGASWAPIGTALAGGNPTSVETVIELGDGRFFAGGSFVSAGGIQAGMAFAGGMAIWDGVEWTGFESGFDDWPWNFAVAPTGELVAGGRFRFAPGTAANRIVRWNGIEWQALGSGLNDEVLSVAVLPDGDIVAGGRFTMAGGVPANRIARWNGSEWVPLGSGSTREVTALAVLPDGTLVAGGNFTVDAGPLANYIAKWDGTAWSNMHLGVSNYVYRLLPLPNGDLVAGGTFTNAGGVSALRVARWNGVSWSAMGAGMDREVFALALLPNGDVAAGGFFTTPASRVASWDGTAWRPLGDGIVGSSGFVRAMTTTPAGDLIVSGDFLQAGSVQANRIARWDGAQWSALGSGATVVIGANLQVLALATLPDGEVVAGGTFAYMGGQASGLFARWTDDNLPWFARQPSGVALEPGEVAMLTTTPAVGYDALMFQWQRESVPGSGVFEDVVDGPGGASPGGGTVSGAAGMVDGGTELVLAVSSAQPSDSGLYRCRVESACGTRYSNTATVTIESVCPPDLTGSAIAASPAYGVPDGVVNGDDFFFYLAEYVAGNLGVCDLTSAGALPGQVGYGVPDGMLNEDDFVYYLSLFAAGC